MTTKEIFEKYLILFKITVSQAGEETNNSVYKNVYNIFEDYDSTIQSAIEREVPFSLFVSICITIIIYEVNYKKKKDFEMDQEEIQLTNSLIDDFWARYIKKPTRLFTSKYGLSTVNNLEYETVIINKNKLK